jgi:hypothetical protein
VPGPLALPITLRAVTARFQAPLDDVGSLASLRNRANVIILCKLPRNPHADVLFHWQRISTGRRHRW